MKQLLFVISIFLLFSCKQDATEPLYLEGEAFGTTYHIKFFSKEPFNAQRGIDSVVQAINQSMSTYIADSDISRVNRGDSTVVVDSNFREVFEISAEINKTTDGYFDPTIGALRNAYGFGDVKPLKNIDSKTLDSLMQFVGFNKVELNEDGTISKEFPQIYFDFNAIAKGFGVDCMGRYLESMGVSDYLIEVGGEILAKGSNLTEGHPWTIGIETPDSELEAREYKAAVKLKNEGLAASGNYRKFRVDSATGKKYVHTINPLTGSAEQSDVTSSTVIAPTCGVADAYATAFMALGIERSKELLKKLPGIEAYLTYTDSLNQDQLFLTTGFKERLSQ